MIQKIIVGDIRSSENPRDIIIGMNSELGEVSALGYEVLKDSIPRTSLIDLGTVLTFELDSLRSIHMIICHHLGTGGWRDADKYVRVGMDQLWTNQRTRQFSIVEIGTGEIGRRDGANSAMIHTAISTSYLNVELWIRNEDELPVRRISAPTRTLKYLRGFSPIRGQLIEALN